MSVFQEVRSTKRDLPHAGLPLPFRMQDWSQVELYKNARSRRHLRGQRGVVLPETASGYTTRTPLPECLFEDLLEVVDRLEATEYRYL